jgi:light-regulated signal transduction histidine kinase (bacteriophytochrome)
MIDGLLSFSRLGRTSLQRQTVSTRHAVEDVIAELSPSAPTGSATRFELGALPEVHADPVLIRQAFANLISNAVKYSRQHPSPIVRIGSQIQGDQVTVFHIRDNGVGFEMSHAGKLFGVFQRLHAQSEFEGTGIGLALTYRIITRHGGRIWAEAEPGKGATFYFTLPPPPDATPNPP